LAERLEVRHHLIDIKTIAEKFSNGDFQRECQKVFHDVSSLKHEHEKNEHDITRLKYNFNIKETETENININETK